MTLLRRLKAALLCVIALVSIVAYASTTETKNMSAYSEWKQLNSLLKQYEK